MKKNYKSILSVGLGLMLSTIGFSQAINESFDDITTLAASGWVMNNLSTPIGTQASWFQAGATPPFAPFGGTDYIAANYNNVAGAADISNWLITPSRTFNNGDVVTFYTRTVDAPAYADRLQVRLSVNGTSTNVGTTNASVGDFTTLLLDINPTLILTGAGSYPNVWTQYTLTVSGLPMPMTGRLAFRYYVTNGGPTGANSDFIGIDDFVYTPSGSASANVSVAHMGEYTEIPQTQITALPLQARVSNIGTASTSDAILTARVFQAPNFTTPIQTATSTATSIANGANAVVNTGATFTPVAGNDYVIQYISSCTGNTVTTADTSNYGFSIVTNEYARDNGTSIQGVGAGTGLSVIIGNNFQVNAAAFLDSTLFFIYPGAAGIGDTVRVRISSTTAGVPSNSAYVGYSAPYVLTAADTSGVPIVLPVTNLTSGRLSLSPGTYFVGLEKYFTADNYGLQCAASIFTANTVYANINNGVYSPLNTLLAGFNYTPIIRPYLNGCTLTATATATTNCGGNTGTATALPASGSAPYTYIWSNGATTATINNLPGGTYTATVTANDGCTATASTVVTNVTLDLTTSTAANVISSNATGVTYQWIDCGNSNAIIAGETNQSYTATASGNYAVIVTNGTCSDTSACVNITVTGINEATSTANVSLYPNPNTGSFVITSSEHGKYVIYNELGQEIRSFELNQKNNYSISVSDLSNGVYMLTGYTSNKVVNQKIIVNK